MTNSDPAIRQVVDLGFPWQTLDPFLFCVHHEDHFPRGNCAMGPDPKLLEGRNIGMDFEIRDGWRMYHGESVPGFPAHPHRGFETVTVVTRGYVDHADSLGAAGRYGEGDTQWMTAGKGVQHSEMFPLLPVARHGPFVMNTESEIRQAFTDFRRDQSGGWPWPRPDQVHEKAHRRFARYADGRVEERLVAATDRLTPI